MKIKEKILFSVLILILVSLGLFGGISTYIAKDSLETEAKNSIEIQAEFLMDNLKDLNENSKILEKAMLDGYDQSIKEHVEIVISIIQKYYDDYQKGVYATEDEAKKAAKEMISTIRYGESGYIWMDNGDYDLLVLPPNPEKEGMNRYDVQDKTGFYLLRAIIGNAVKNGSTYTDYWWNKIGTEELFPKRGYSQHFPEWDWIPGTGNYIDEISVKVNANKELLEKQFRENLKESEKNGLAFVFDENGTMVYNSDKRYETKALDVIYSDNEILSKLDDAGFVKFSIQGKEYLGYIIKNSDLDNNLLIAKESKVIFSGVNNMLKAMIGLLVFFIIIGFVVSFLLAHKITEPINKLTDSGNKIADGNLDVELPEIKTKDEIESLSGTMHMLVGALKFLKGKNKKK